MSNQADIISVIKRKSVNNIEDMPGLVGEIARDIVRTSVRPQSLIAIQAALQTIGAIGASKRITPPHADKLNILTLSVALSMSGKDAPMSYMQKVLRECKIGYRSGISSDKDIILNLAHDHGVSVYSVDEADSIFGKISDSKNSYNSGIGNVLLSSFTADSMALNGKHERELDAVFENEKKAIKKACKDDGMPDGSYENSEQWKALEKTQDYIKGGMQSPHIFFHGATTPKAIDWIANDQFAERGFLGRTILFRCDESRPDAREKLFEIFQNGPVKRDQDLLERIKNKHKFLTPCKASIDPAAMDFVRVLIDWQEDNINSQEGTLTARMMEIVGRLATIIAIGDSQNGTGVVVTEEHLQWAFAIFYRSYSDMKAMITINSDDSGVRDKILSRIIQVTSAEGTHISSIEQKFKGKKWTQDIEKVFTFSGMAKDLDERSMPNADQKVKMVIGAFLAGAEEEGSIRIEGKKAFRLND